MSEYEVEKGVPIPKNNTAKFPLASMDVGDSFKFAKEDVSRLRSAARYYCKNKPAKFFISDGRCWRTR
jgi:hypothetical protein